MDERQQILHRLTGQLDHAVALRATASADPVIAAARLNLRRWQAGRLARTHADLLENPRFHRMAEFFLTDVYGPEDLGKVYLEAGRIVPVMGRLLPTAGLVTVGHVTELEALTEELDAAMAVMLGSTVLDAAAYGGAYRRVDRPKDRERQILLIEEVGVDLERLGRVPLVGATLAAMRVPAWFAGLANLLDFLERGYAAFHETKGVDEFLKHVVTRERAVMAALFAGNDAVLDGNPGS